MANPENYRRKYVISFIISCALILAGSTLIDAVVILHPDMSPYWAIGVSLLLLIIGIILFVEAIFYRLRAEFNDPNSDLHQQNNELVTSVKDSVAFYTRDFKRPDYKVLTSVAGETFARVPISAFNLAEQLKGEQIIEGDVCTIPIDNPLDRDASKFYIAVAKAGSRVNYHLHKAQNQKMFVISGELDQLLRGSHLPAEETHRMRENDSIFIPAGVEHETIHITDCCYFLIYQPVKNDEQT